MGQKIIRSTAPSNTVWLKGSCRNIQPVEYALPEGASVLVVDDVASSEQALAPLLSLLRDSETPPVLGVDTEWVAGRPVSLLQASSALILQ